MEYLDLNLKNVDKIIYELLKREEKRWLIESNIIKDNEELESKAKGYRIIRNIIKENEKTLL